MCVSPLRGMHHLSGLLLSLVLELSQDLARQTAGIEMRVMRRVLAGGGAGHRLAAVVGVRLLASGRRHIDRREVQIAMAVRREVDRMIVRAEAIDVVMMEVGTTADGCRIGRSR